MLSQDGPFASVTADAARVREEAQAGVRHDDATFFGRPVISRAATVQNVCSVRPPMRVSMRVCDSTGARDELFNPPGGA